MTAEFSNAPTSRGEVRVPRTDAAGMVDAMIDALFPILSGASVLGLPTLGRVDELFDDNPHGNEMDQSQKGLAQFLIPRGNASKLLEIVEEPFDLLTEFVEVFIIV